MVFYCTLTAISAYSFLFKWAKENVDTLCPQPILVFITHGLKPHSHKPPLKRYQKILLCTLINNTYIFGKTRVDFTSLSPRPNPTKRPQRKREKETNKNENREGRTKKEYNNKGRGYSSFQVSCP